MTIALDHARDANTADPHERRRFQFVVRGTPAPQGSKSYKGHSKAGHAILVESSAAVKPWRVDVVDAATQKIAETPGFKPFLGPVHLIIEFYVHRPAGAPKTRRAVPATSPDLSKLIRSTEDALKTAAVWRDDGQVIDMTIRERHATLFDEAIGHPWELPGPGAVITVVEIDPEDTWADQPLDLLDRVRFPMGRIPDELAEVIIAPFASAGEWGESLIIPAGITDARARTLLRKALTASERRLDLPRYDVPDNGYAVIIEGSTSRLASPVGKPLTPLQHDIAAVLKDREHTGMTVVLAEVIG